MTGFVTALASLIAILVIDGLTTGSVTALHAPLVMDTYPPAARVRAMSLYYAGGFAGQVGAPLLVALFAGLMDLTWRGVFIAMGTTSVQGQRWEIKSPGGRPTKDLWSKLTTDIVRDIAYGREGVAPRGAG